MTTIRSNLAARIHQLVQGCSDKDDEFLSLSLLFPPNSRGCQALVRAALRQRESRWDLKVAHEEADKP